MLRCFGDVGENLPLKPSLTRSTKIKMSRVMAVTLKDHLQAHRIFVNMMIKKRRLMMTLSPSCSTRSSWILSMKPLLGFLQSIIRVRQNLYYYYHFCSCYCYCYHNHPSSASGRTFTEILLFITQEAIILNFLKNITCSLGLRMCSGMDQGSPRSQTSH